MGGFVKFLKSLRLKLKQNRVLKRVSAEEDCMEGMRLVSWEKIEKSTKNFSAVLGYGGFSTVYLADKLIGGSAVAVKVQCSSERLNEAYKKELEILLHLEHPNIVKLLGRCDDRDEGVLIFEYVPNGTLQEKLHGSTKQSLSWKRRMTIAYQLAQAIEYLHQKQIVHGDMKASNILLDDSLNCKLCDFGSAKMGFSSTIQPPTPDSPFRKRNNRIMIMGSPGYTDPQYLRTGLATKKNDVYSFGILLLELITGVEAFNPSTGERLITKSEPMLRDVEKAVEMVDPRMARRGVNSEEVKAIASLSAMCLSDSPGLRPTATDILATMEKAIHSISFILESKNRV